MSEVTKSPYSLDSMKARYAELCRRRDETNDLTADIRARMTAAANESEKYRVQAMQAKADLDKARGGTASWFALKREIGLLADMIQRSK